MSEARVVKQLTVWFEETKRDIWKEYAPIQVDADLEEGLRLKVAALKLGMHVNAYPDRTGFSCIRYRLGICIDVNARERCGTPLSIHRNWIPRNICPGIDLTYRCLQHEDCRLYPELGYACHEFPGSIKDWVLRTSWRAGGGCLLVHPSDYHRLEGVLISVRKDSSFHGRIEESGAFPGLLAMTWDSKPTQAYLLSGGS